MSKVTEKFWAWLQNPIKLTFQKAQDSGGRLTYQFLRRWCDSSPPMQDQSSILKSNVFHLFLQRSILVFTFAYYPYKCFRPEKAVSSPGPDSSLFLEWHCKTVRKCTATKIKCVGKCLLSMIQFVYNTLKRAGWKKCTLPLRRGGSWRYYILSFSSFNRAAFL